MQYTIPTTKTELMTTLGSIFYYYRIRREAYDGVVLTDLTLNRLTFTPLSDAELTAKAQTLVEAEQQKTLMDYQAEITSKINKLTTEISEKTASLAVEIASVNSRYTQSETTIENKARKNGLSASNIILDKISDLEAKKNAEITALNTKYNSEIAELNGEKTALQTKLNNASSYFSTLFTYQKNAKKIELASIQDQTVMEVFKYNNGLDEKEKNSRNNNIKSNASLRIKYLEVSGDFFTKDQLVEMGYYDDVITCISGYYDTLNPVTAYNDMKSTTKLAIYLDDYYEDLLYLYKTKAMDSLS